MIVKLIYKSLAFPSSIPSYSSNSVTQSSQSVTSTSRSSSLYKSSSFESSTSFVSSDDDSYDSDLLHKGTQPVFSILPEFSTSFESITITPATKSYYSSGSDGATGSLSSEFVSNSVYSSDYGILSVSITSSEALQSVSNSSSIEATDSRNIIPEQSSGAAYSSTTISVVVTAMSSLSEIAKTSDFTSSTISSVELSSSTPHLSASSIDVDNSGSLSTLNSHNISVSSSVMSFSMEPSSTFTSSTFIGPSTASSFTEDVSSCNEYSTFTTTNVEGSVVFQAACIDLLTSNLVLISDARSNTDSSVSSGSSEITTSFKLSASMLSVQSSSVLSSMESSTIQSHVSSILTGSSSVFTATSISAASTAMESDISSAFSSMETEPSCDEYTIILAKNAYGSLVSQAVCIESSSTDYTNLESSSDSVIAPTTTIDLVQGTISSLDSVSVDITSFCDHSVILSTKDSNGILTFKTICEEPTTTSIQHSSTLESDTSTSITVKGSQSISSVSATSSLETVLSCDQTTTILTKDANGFIISRTICAESSHTSQSGSSYVSEIDSTFTLSSTDYTSTIPTSSISETSNCDQYTTILGKDANGVSLTQSVCIESISTLSDESSFYTSSIKATPTESSASLSSAVRSVNSFATCDQLSTMLSKDAQGLLIPQTICIDSSVSSITTADTLDRSSIHTITTNSISSYIYTDTSSSSTSIRSSLPSVTAISDCDSFSIFSIKDDKGELMPHTVCIESSSEIFTTVSSTTTFSGLLDKSTASITVSSTKAISSSNSQLTSESSQIVGTSAFSTITMAVS